MILLLEGIGTAAMILAASVLLLQRTQRAPADGTAAPDFILKSQDNKSVSLRELRGKWVVLYFYPKDFTSGCTIEARNFQRDAGEYEKRNAAILGVSTQDEKTHKAFCTKEDRKSTRLNSSHLVISYAVFCLKKKQMCAHM